MILLYHEGSLRPTLFREWSILCPIETDSHRIDSEWLESECTRVVGCEGVRAHMSDVCSHICIFICYAYSVSYVFGCVNFFSWIYLSASRTTSADMPHLASESLPIWKKRIARIQQRSSQTMDTMNPWWRICGWDRSSHSAKGNGRWVPSSWKKNSQRRWY